MIFFIIIIINAIREGMPSEKFVLAQTTRLRLSSVMLFFVLFLFFFKHMKNIILGDKSIMQNCYYMY